MTDLEQIYNSVKGSVNISFGPDDYKKDENGFVISDTHEVMLKGKPITTAEFLKAVFSKHPNDAKDKFLGDCSHNEVLDNKRVESALKHLPKGSTVNLEYSPEKIKELLGGKDYNEISLEELRSPQVKEAFHSKFLSWMEGDNIFSKKQEMSDFLYEHLCNLKKQNINVRFYEDDARLNFYLQSLAGYEASYQKDLETLNKTFELLAPEAQRAALQGRFNNLNFSRNVRDEGSVQNISSGQPQVVLCGAGHLLKSDDLDNRLTAATGRRSIKIITAENENDLNETIGRMANEVFFVQNKDAIKKKSTNDIEIQYTPEVKPNFEMPDYVMIENYKGQGPRVFKGDEFIKDKFKELGINYQQDNSKPGKQEYQMLPNR